ncbi:DMT family transporter [Mesorhizobium sp. M3A.F.Ca.ET.080.04.2.1]|uniref:DMT family transporter n=1 Tax=Mesorhizobium sp. M3A.F.Ca.ET.080.04.2.1 TaxID=2493676 RepID=UPI000F74C959|nr:DMT family transporter [Mesorhizobium sp. M3A.F.Ca.ET.080.04.2.1]AZO09650.1 DMT family transporter [Mesorhizobium sp. M3A.F.Ca.ET.080.04.2.1]RWF24161.1 MAG: DMT family transporter [Mesorhizobium sp.]TGT57653.1 DMT family transporter [Mesorhizobium sp. M00.F.Ca.ET.170.01.1.1]
MSETASPRVALPAVSPREERIGMLLVFLSALMWSFGGAIARFIHVDDNWTIVFWRSLWAVAFLIAFMAWRDGWRGIGKAFRDMGLPGLGVALCFATASTSFVVALSYTTVANILLMQAGVPLLAALLSWVLFRERVSLATWIAIAAVITGVAIMVSESLGGTVSPIGDGLALLIAVVFSVATVVTRRFAHVRMVPANCLAALLAGAFAATQASEFAVSARDMGFLFAFGVLNLGVGLAFFAMGARLVPAAVAALLGTFEPILGPIWVWLVHSEVPSLRTIIGGTVVVVALLVHIGLEFKRQARPQRPGVTGLPAPN